MEQQQQPEREALETTRPQRNPDLISNQNNRSLLTAIIINLQDFGYRRLKAIIRGHTGLC